MYSLLYSLGIRGYKNNMADEAKWAAQNGDLEKLKLLIESGVSRVFRF